MANSQELMLRIRGDNTDVEKKLSQTGKSVEGIKTTTEKASSALRGFGRDLLQARDASDLVSSATRALGSAIAGSLGGIAVIAAGQAIIDSYRKVQAAASESEKAISEARKSAESIGASEGIQTTATAAKSLFAEASKVSEKLKEIESNPLQNFIAGITGAKERMAELVVETQKQASAISEQGVRNALAQNEITAGLSEQDKQLRAIAESYTPIIKAARETGNQDLLNAAIMQQQGAVAKKIADDKKAMADEDKKIAERRAKFDQDSATENELNEIKRQRELERTRAELQIQVRQNEEKLKQEQELARLSEEQAKLKASESAQGGGAGASRLQGKEVRDTMGTFEELLQGSRAGRDALETERRKRFRKNSRENFQLEYKTLGEEAARLSKLEGRTVTRQDVRNRMAAQIAAGENPTLLQKAGGQENLNNSIEKLISLIESAPLVTSGAG